MLGAAGGAIFGAAAGVAIHRAVAYGLYVAAAVVLLLAPIAGTRLVYRRTNLPLVETWVFVAAAFLLCGIGAAVEVA